LDSPSREARLRFYQLVKRAAPYISIYGLSASPSTRPWTSRKAWTAHSKEPRTRKSEIRREFDRRGEKQDINAGDI